MGGCKDNMRYRVDTYLLGDLYFANYMKDTAILSQAGVVSKYYRCKMIHKIWICNRIF